MTGSAVRIADNAENVAVIKAASTAPLATDPALVVTMSPNSSTAGVAQGSATSGQSGTLAQGAVTTAAPTYTTGQTDPLSLTTGGGLRGDITSIAGTAVNASNGAVGLGTLRVAVGTGNSAIASWGHGATGAAIPTGATMAGAVAATANPAAVTNGQLVGLMANKVGSLVVQHAAPRELVGVQHTALAASSETTIVSQAASEFHDIAWIMVTTAGAVAATLTLRDGTGGAIKAVWNYPNAAVAPSGPLFATFDPPLPAAAVNTNWTIQNSVTTATDIMVGYVKSL